ncbi:LysR family transcriptional regulator [Actinomadura madurae]|uniref:LysR family transcriptional regulator n=1 Tax=Actinomadura madurae TaxID=1993 RepID=UPI0020D245EE|nr:LysR family transcriptional regulator [Actinomadura madurae]MCP9971291.1 LysR family transcriptional regulator [Actinomadura madurae]
MFVAVCASGNLSAVARDLSCSQSAVSQHVKRLERETGLVLLERRPRGVVPTRAGRILNEAAAEGIAGLDAALRRLDDLRRGVGGTVRIATGATTVRHFMAAGVAVFRARHPEAALQFETAGSSRRCLEAVRAHTADLAWVTIGPPLEGVEQRASCELPWVLAVHAADPLAGREAIALDDLSGIRYIELPAHSTSRVHLEMHLERHGVRPASTTSVADWDTALLLAELGLGHAILPGAAGLGRRDGRRPPGPRPGPAAAHRRLGRPPVGRPEPAGRRVRRHRPGPPADVISARRPARSRPSARPADGPPRSPARWGTWPSGSRRGSGRAPSGRPRRAA